MSPMAQQQTAPNLIQQTPASTTISNNPAIPSALAAQVQAQAAQAAQTQATQPQTTKDGSTNDQTLAAVPLDDPQEKNEFQDFVNSSTKRNLPLFGYNLFRGAPSTFAPLDRIPVTADYVLGPGDEIVIRAWGQIDIDYRATVDRNGDLLIPKVGNISVTGIKYQELQGYLKNAIGRVFRNFDLNVSLGQLRSIQVFVVGYARHPGSYTVSSLSTLVNTLFASGGPSARGSMRRIQLKRGSQVVTEFDMYDLLIKGDKSKDVRLLPGDVIYIPAMGPLVAVSGSVNTPAIYELKSGQTLEETISLAGGITTTAAVEKVMVERIVNRKARIVDEFPLNHAGMSRAVEDGDLINVLPISPRFDNAVTLRGNVDLAARYPWKKGMRIKDLIPERDALITRDYWLTKNAATQVEIDSQAKLKNDIKLSIAEVNWDYAVIERLNQDDLTTRLIPFNLAKAIAGTDPAFNPELEPGDVVTIFSKNDIQVPQSRQNRYVRLEGEFSQAGVYQAQPGETLRQLIARAGGLTPQAYLYGAEFTRESARTLQQQKMDEATDQLERDLERTTAAKAQSALSQEEALQIKQEAESRKALIARLRQVKATGRIPLDLPDDLAANSLPDLTLEDGDRFMVPPRPSIVSLIGAVYNQNTFLYKEGKSVDDYLRQAGGPTKDADEKSIYIFKANGTVVSRRQSGLFSSFSHQRLMPGDTIVVPEQLNKTSWLKDLRDWSQVFYQFGLGAAAINVLKK